MKTIEPVSIWVNGNNILAMYLNAFAVNVTLGKNATFSYSLLDENQMTIVGGNLTMDGEAYEQWTIDAYAWDWIAEQLNLTITGDYIPPVPPQPEPQPETPIDPAVESPAV